MKVVLPDFAVKNRNIEIEIRKGIECLMKNHVLTSKDKLLLVLYILRWQNVNIPLKRVNILPKKVDNLIDIEKSLIYNSIKGDDFMNKNVYDFYVNKKHHIYRHNVEWNLADEYASKNLSPIERMADRFSRLCDEEKPVIIENEQIVFMRTVANLPAIFTDVEWEEINKNHQ